MRVPLHSILIKVFTVKEGYSIFLLSGESGLRIGELMSCQIEKSQKMLILNNITGSTKHSWVSSYSTPIEGIPEISIKRIQFVFEETNKATEI